MRVAISDFRALLYVRCFWVRMVRATLFCLASTWNWKPETGLAVVVDAKAALEPVRWFWREKRRRRRCQRRNPIQETHPPSQRRGKRIKGGETPPKSSIGHSCAHIFSETSFARPLATRLVVEPTRARAQNNRLRAFASRRVHLSSRARLVSKRSPPPLSFPSKTSFFFDANLCERGGKNESKKKMHSFARRALFGNAAPRHANKKKERKRKGRTHRYSIGWKGRTEQSWGWSRTCFFSSSFCCVRVKMCEVPFFSFEGKRKSEATTKKGFKVSSIFTP